MNRPTEPNVAAADGGAANPSRKATEVDLSLQVDVDLNGDEPQPTPADAPSSPPAADGGGFAVPAASAPIPDDPEAQTRATIALFEQEAKARGNDPTAAPLFHEMGRLWELRLKSPRNAAACYQSAYNLDPTYRPNLKSARRLFAQVGNWQMVEQLLDAEVRSVAPPIEPRDGELPKVGAALGNPEVRSLLLEKAALLAERLGRPAEASALLTQLQGADPLDPTPGAALETLDTGDGAPQSPTAQIELLTQLAGAVEDVPLKVYYLTTAASIQEEKLKQPDEAAALYRKALELNRRDPAAVGGVKAHAERQGRWDELLQTLYAEARAEKGSAAAAILYQAARLCSEKLGRDGDAVEALVLARQQAPQDPLVLGELARLYEQMGRFPELAEVLSERAAGCRNPVEAVEVLLKLGALYEERLGREDDAIACYRSVLASMPHHASVLASLGKLYHRRGMWQDLVWTYEQETAAAADSRTRVGKLYKAAEILETKLDRIDDAINRYNEVLSQQGGFLPAQKALTRLYERLGRFQELCALLEKDVSQTKDRDQRISLRTQIAQIYELRLKDPDKAIKLLSAIVEEVPDHLPTIRSLAQLCERAKRWKELVWANELEAGLAGDQKQVISLLHRNGEILEDELGDKDAAVETYQKVLALSPSYLPALKALGKLYAQRGRWEELVTMYRQEAEVAQSSDEAASLILKIGQLYEEKLLREEQALLAYREVLTLLPGHLPALASLQRIYRNQRNWEGLLEVLRAEAEARPDPNDRAPVLFATGEIAEQRLERADVAAEAYQEVLKLVPDHALALRALERLYSAAACWRELCQVYERQLATAPVGPARAAPYLKLARLYAERLGDLQKAAQCFEAALTSAPDPELTLTALKGLERLRGAVADRGRRAEIRAKLAARISDKRMASQLELSAGADRERAGGSPDPTRRTPGEINGAMQDYRRALDLWPENERAAGALEITLRRAGDSARLAELLQNQLARAAAGPMRAELALELADLYAQELREPGLALKAAQAGIADVPDSLPLLHLTRALQEATGDFAGARATALTEAQACKDTPAAVQTLMAAAEISRTKLRDKNLAAADYRQVLARDPLHHEATARLGELLKESGDAAALLEIQERQADALVVKKDPAAADALIEVAARIVSTGGEPLRAIDALDRAIGLRPEAGRAHFARAEILARLGSFPEAADAYRKAAELGSNPQELAEAHFRLGMILQDHLKDSAKAATHFQAAVSANQKHYPALERLALAHEANGNWSGADYALGLIENAAPDTGILARALVTHARVLLDGLGDGNAALQRVQKAHGLLPDDPHTLSILCALEQRLRDWEGAAKTCERLANLKEATDPQASRAFRMRAAEIFNNELRRSNDAVQCYKRALDLDPSDEQARAALADLYASDPAHLNDAIGEHRWLLRGDASRVESYRALFKIFNIQQQLDRTYCTAAALSALQVGDDEPQTLHAELRRRLPAEPSGNITDEQRDRLLSHPEGRTTLGPLLRILGEHLEKIAAWPQESFSLGRGDRLKADHPLRTLAQTLAGQIGVGEFEMYQGKANEVVALPTSPPALVVGANVVRRYQSREQRFLLARALARIFDGSQVAAFVTPDWVADLLGAAVRLAQPAARQTIGRPGPQTDEIEKRLQKSLPRKARKALEDLLASPLRGPPDGGQAWARSLLVTADRTALLYGIDVASGLSAALGLENASTAAVAQVMRERPDVAELFRFSVSEELFQLRAALRVNVA